MLRDLSAVTLSSLMGSVLGTLMWVALEGGTGALNPIRFVTAFAMFTMLFTFPGATLLLYLTIRFADRGLTAGKIFLLLLAGGTVAGAGLLTFLTPKMMPVGAMFGFSTAAAFVAVIRVLKVYPAGTR